MKHTNYFLLLILAMLASLAGCERGAQGMAGGAAMDPAEDAPGGAHGGRLLIDGDFSLELAIVETGIPPEYRAWAMQGDEPIAPNAIDLTVELTRLGGVIDRIAFAPLGDYLRGNQTVYEPHSFDVRVTAVAAGITHQFAYESHEGRTSIPAQAASAAGIETAVAGPGRIVETVQLFGTISPAPTRVREVTARFAGLIGAVHAEIGDRVARGDALVSIESNESLQSYTVTAPIGGVITARHAEPGEQAGDAALFEVADYSTVWAELSAFPRDRARLAVGQSADIRADNGAAATAPISYLAPAGNRGSQSVTARVVLANPDGRWTPGQFIEGRITVAESAVALAVPVSALQTFRDFTVVFARVGDTYEVRMLELGRRDDAHVEVLGGLPPGSEYVIENSYLIKADIEKSGASHDH
jgi:cobalt-zinc-cadmium efflux system membrane fusion protein